MALSLKEQRTYPDKDWCHFKHYMCSEQGCVKLSVKTKMIYLKQNFTEGDSNAFTQRWIKLSNLCEKKNCLASSVGIWLIA